MAAAKLSSVRSGSSLFLWVGFASCLPAFPPKLEKWRNKHKGIRILSPDLSPLNLHLLLAQNAFINFWYPLIDYSVLHGSVSSLLWVAVTVLSADAIMIIVKSSSSHGIRTNPWISFLSINCPPLPLKGTCQSAPNPLTPPALLVFNFLIPAWSCVVCSGLWSLPQSRGSGARPPSP